MGFERRLSIDPCSYIYIQAGVVVYVRAHVCVYMYIYKYALRAARVNLIWSGVFTREGERERDRASGV